MRIETYLNTSERKSLLLLGNWGRFIVYRRDHQVYVGRPIPRDVSGNVRIRASGAAPQISS